MYLDTRKEEEKERREGIRTMPNTGKKPLSKPP